MGTMANSSHSGPGRSWALSSGPQGPVTLPGAWPCRLLGLSTERLSTGSHLETIVLVALEDIIKILGFMLRPQRGGTQAGYETGSR